MISKACKFLKKGKILNFEMSGSHQESIKFSEKTDMFVQFKLKKFHDLSYDQICQEKNCISNICIVLHYQKLYLYKYFAIFFFARRKILLNFHIQRNTRLFFPIPICTLFFVEFKNACIDEKL